MPFSSPRLFLHHSLRHIQFQSVTPCTNTWILKQCKFSIDIQIESSFFTSYHQLLRLSDCLDREVLNVHVVFSVRKSYVRSQ